MVYCYYHAKFGAPSLKSDCIMAIQNIWYLVWFGILWYGLLVLPISNTMQNLELLAWKLIESWHFIDFQKKSLSDWLTDLYYPLIPDKNLFKGIYDWYRSLSMHIGYAQRAQPLEVQWKQCLSS